MKNRTGKYLHIDSRQLSKQVHNLSPPERRRIVSLRIDIDLLAGSLCFCVVNFPVDAPCMMHQLQLSPL